jgi:hypothetical protein
MKGKEVGGQNEYDGEPWRPWRLARRQGPTRRQGRCPVRGGEARRMIRGQGW